MYTKDESPSHDSHKSDNKKMVRVTRRGGGGPSENYEERGKSSTCVPN